MAQIPRPTASAHRRSGTHAPWPVDVALDGHACGIARYYTHFHAVTKDTLGPVFAAPDHFRLTCGGFTEPKWRAALEAAMPTWIIVAKEPLVNATRDEAARWCLSLAEQSWPSGTTLFHCADRTNRAPGPARRPARSPAEAH